MTMSIVKNLLHSGYAIIKISEAVALQMAILKLEALKFFLSPREKKEEEFFKGQHIGYRPIGGEYVSSPEQWDVNESLNFSRMSSHFVSENSMAKNFYLAAERLFPVLDDIIQSFLYELKSHYKFTGSVPKTSGSSWIQVNYYQQTTANMAGRELMQGKHQDGHIITLWNAQEAGMEFFPSGPGHNHEPMVLGHDELLLMPGDLLTKISGGDIKPLYHQVRCIDAVYTRLAVMYFSNPDPDASCLPMAPHAEQVDISAIVKEEKLLIRPGVPKFF